MRHYLVLPNDQRQPPPGFIYTQIDRIHVASP